MTVYIELVFFENFAIDYFLLLAGEKITYTKAQHPVIAAIFGGIYAVIMPLFYNTDFIQTFIVLALMCAICFKPKSIKIFIYVLTAVSAGAGALFGITNLFFAPMQSGFFYEGSIFFIVSLSSILFSVGLYRLLIPFMRKKGINDHTAVIHFENRELSAFVDSGNSLYYKNLPVILINKELIYNMPEKPLIIPYSAIGKSGALLGFYPENITVSYMDKQIKPACVIAMCDNNFQNKFDALVHPDIIKECV